MSGSAIMTSSLTYRPSTSGITASSNGINRQTSLSSFPSTRVPSSHSNRPFPPIEKLPPVPKRSSTDSYATRSTRSSLRQTPPGQATTRSPRKVRSQYPADSKDQHVEYILVASFDINEGCVMEHQYPTAISGDEQMLAALMLPDQAHARKEDWTIFFLHKDIGEGEEGVDSQSPPDSSKPNVRQENGEIGDSDGANEEQDVEGGEGPPLIYVLNLVNTKHDSRAKRGAVVKAMAICTRHSFLHIYKPLLLLALEEYYKSPVPETLETLYNAVNSMDLSLMPRLSMLERNILLASDTKDLFIEKFDQMIQQHMAIEANNFVSSPDSPQKSSSEMINQRTKPTTPRDTHEFECKVMYNSVPVPIKVPAAISPETVGDFSLIKLIQSFSHMHTTQPQPFALHTHLTTSGAFTHPIIVLINAILTQKRVIFLGHNRPSGEVAEAVLAACALASGGILRGFTRHAFPYTDLSKIEDLLNVPGFIAGVTNPTFANHPEWWDLLCDLPAGRMKISSRIEAAPVTAGLHNFQQQNPTFALSPTGLGSKDSASHDATGDTAFMEAVSISIASRHGESVIRARFRDLIHKFTRISAAFEESVYGASALYIGAAEADGGEHGIVGHGYVWPDDAARSRELGANVWRIEGWRNTRSYYALIQDLAALWERKPIRSIDLAYQHDRLRSQKMSHDASGAIYLALAASVQSYDEVCQLLTVMPESNGGLFHVSLGLFHPEVRVRLAAVELLDRMIEHEAGRHFWAHLGRFAKLAYDRSKKESQKRMEQGSPTSENDDDLRLDSARVRSGMRAS